MDFMSPKDIYKEVLKETDTVLQALAKPASNADLFAAIETARESFSQLKCETNTVLQDLDENAEWDVLTVALYGETNAGKSTIIETLRILMGEKSKQEQRRKFRETREKFYIDENIVKTWKRINSRVDQLTAEIKALPCWRHALSFAWKIPAKAELNAANAELNTFIMKNQQLSQKHEQEKSKILATIDSEKGCEVAAVPGVLICKEFFRLVRVILAKNIFKNHSHENKKAGIAGEVADNIDATMKELERCQDDTIIGDGRSDFTRESTSYEFTAKDNKFVLLDIPGIEGKEELVRKPIMQAVRKAHAVFYVTRKANPPQKGDEKTGEKGTLEKIKEHLGAQTEVWTIFNKSIKSAEQLRTPQLVNQGELDSLKVLEEEMRKQLGEHYAGSLIVSAYPAFIASTDHFLPGDIKSKDRSKFLAVMKPADILDKTGFEALASKLGSEMAENTKAKIRKSNFNKANDAVLYLKKKVVKLNKETFKPLLGKLEDQAHDSTLELESATDALNSNIESVAMSLIKKKRDNVRKNIYKDIDQNIDNDDFKGYLKQYIEAGTEATEKEFPVEIKKQIETFQEEVKGIADQFQEHVQEFLDDASMAGDMDFNLNIKIDNGISVAELIGAVTGAVFLIFVSDGWVLVVGVFHVIVSGVKIIWAFFDDDYKKAQQRKAADENINKIFRHIESSYVSQLKESMQKLKKNLVRIKNKFQIPAQQVEQITSLLNDSVRRLELVSRKIVKEGGL